LETVEKKQENT